MNKQQALEALLAKCRQWEEPHEEVRATDPRVVARELQVSAADLAEDMGTDDAEAYLITIGAAALYLLVDEVDVVTGKSLEEWLREQPVASRVQTTSVSFPMHSPVGQQMLTILNQGHLDVPRPSNGRSADAGR